MPPIDPLLPSRQVSQSSVSLKAPEATQVAINEVNLSDSETSSSPIISTHHSSISVHSEQSTDSLEEVTRSVRVYLVGKINDVDYNYFEGIDRSTFIETISNERLLHMPRRGSQWDRVLKAAEFFGLQVSAFGEAIKPFSRGTEPASSVILGSCCILLEVSVAGLALFPFHYLDPVE